MKHSEDQFCKMDHTTDMSDRTRSADEDQSRRNRHAWQKRARPIRDFQ